MFGLFLHSVCVLTVDLLMLKFQANKQTSLAISPHPARPSASSANFTTGHNLCIALITVRYHPLIAGREKFTLIFKAARQCLKPAQPPVHSYSQKSIWVQKESVSLSITRIKILMVCSLRTCIPMCSLSVMRLLKHGAMIWSVFIFKMYC